MMNSLYIILLCLYSVCSKDVLRHVSVIYRHGDRSPVRMLRDDYNHANIWPSGLGQLTEIGIRQQFALGKWLRNRYRHLLSKEYDHNEVYVRSTDMDRTLMSAQSNLAGLYYVDQSPIIPSVNWRPIPVHTVPKASDPFMTSFQCNGYNRKLQDVYKTAKYKAFFNGFNRTLGIMRNITGKNDLQYHDSWYVYDCLFCEKEHNVSSSILDEVYSNISRIFKINWKAMFDGEELARLSGGRFLDEISNEMREMSENNYLPLEKMRMYSGHDVNIASLLAAMGIYDGTQPPYASCLMIELLHNHINSLDQLSNWVVRVYYKTDQTNLSIEIPEQRLNGCKSDPCTLRDFMDFIKPRVVTAGHYQRVCHTSNSVHFTQSLSLPIYALLLVLSYVIMSH